MRSPSFEIVELSSECWEVDYREIKQTLLNSKHHLRSKKHEMIIQLLWRILLCNNLLKISYREEALRKSITLNSLEIPLRLSSLCTGKYRTLYFSSKKEKIGAIHRELDPKP